MSHTVISRPSPPPSFDCPPACGQAPAEEAPPPPPASGAAQGWRQVLADTLAVMLSAGICHALGIFTSVGLRRFLGPSPIGIWQGLKLVLSYANFANLGASKGAARELTVALGRQDPEAATAALNLAFTVNTLSSIFYAVCVLAGAGWLAWRQPGPWASDWAGGLAFVAVLVILQRHVSFQITILRCRQQFQSTARIAMLEAGLTLLLAVPAAWLLGLPGVYLATLAVVSATWWYLRQRMPAPLHWAWNRGQARRLIGLGAPLLVAGGLASVYRALDKLVILVFAVEPEYTLGCYSLALLVSSQLFGVGNLLAIVMGPRYGALWGRTGRPADVAALAARASELQAAGLGLLGGLAIVTSGPVLGAMLPEFTAGLGATVWLVPGTLALSLALPCGQYLAAIYRERRGMMVLAANIVAGGLAQVWAIGHGLTTLAAVTSLCQFAYLVLQVRWSFWGELSPAARCRYVAVLAGTLLPPVGTAAALEWYLPSQPGGWGLALTKAAIVGSVWSVVAAAAYFLAGWRHMLQHGQDAEEFNAHSKPAARRLQRRRSKHTREKELVG